MPELASDDPRLVRRTQIVDIGRSVPLGIMLPLESSVLLTIAIKQFDASGLVKGLVAASGGVGMLASPLVTATARRGGRPIMATAAVLSAVSCLGLVLAATGSVPALVIGVIVGIACFNAVIPLMTVTYERNFPSRERGKRVGWGMALKVAVSAVVGVAMGSFLTQHPDRWWVVVLMGAVASAALVWLYAAMPSAPLARVPGHDRPWPHFHLLRTDRRLRLTLGAWMLMGFGNLMLLPLRVEYLAGDEYGIGADAAKITLLTVTVPSAFRLVCMPLFGAVFDRLSFFAARIMVNLLFALYVFAFFTGTSDIGLVIGAVTLGIASAGGDLMWHLWVTKFAPAGRVADYMGLHTFFTGVRAVCAPLLAFAVIDQLPLAAVTWMATALIMASSAVLLPEARAERALRAAEVRPVEVRPAEA